MNTLISCDGTSIAFERQGEGPAVILVGGRSHPLAELLASRFTVYSYDRRGLGRSGNTAPYALAREVEDLEVLIGVAGGSAYVLCLPSAATLALEAVRRLPSITKLAFLS